jgi:hypothetical protein
VKQDFQRINIVNKSVKELKYYEKTEEDPRYAFR